MAAQWWGTDFPWGTLTVNLVGSFVIGFLWQWFERYAISPNVRALIFVGILGAFTTFSSYTLDSLRLLQLGRVLPAVLNVVGSNGLGLTAVYLGTLAARQLLHHIP
jgi:CrcB protein